MTIAFTSVIDHWALVNLFCTISTVILILILTGFGIYKYIKYKYVQYDAERYIRVRSRIVFRLLGIFVAVVSVITFIITQNMTLPMVLIDKYTPWMITYLIIQLHIFISSKSYYPAPLEE